MKTFKELKKPGIKHPIERIMEDFVRSGNHELSNEEQTNIYNDMMYDFFETIRNRISRGQQPMRISEGNKVWENYRNIYTNGKESDFNESCKKAIDLYTGKIPTGYGNEKK